MVETEQTNLKLRGEIQSLESEVGELRLDKRTLEVSLGNLKKMFEDEIDETQQKLSVAEERFAVLLL